MTPRTLAPLACLLLAQCIFRREEPPRPDAAAEAGLDAGPPPGTDAGPPSRPERYIRATPDARLVIELDAVPGAEPRDRASSRLVSRLGTLLDKPGGIEIVASDAIPSRGADHAWTLDELFALADETFDDASPPGTVAMHVMWLDGHDARDDGSGSTLGLAWGNLHVVMFHDTIESSCLRDPLLGETVCAEAQYLVWLHEVGHTIGLVDNGIPMVTPHRDEAHGAHDVDRDCVMYWAFDGSSGLDLIYDRLVGGGSMYDFDPECLADVAAARGR